MRLSLVTATTRDPVALGEVRSWLNFQGNITVEDTVLEILIDEAYDQLEQWTNRKILTQTWKATLDADEVGDVIRLPLVPLISVSSIVTTDDDGTTTTVAATNYQVSAGENPRIVLTDTGEWPDDYREHDAMAITCSVGYNGAVVPFTEFVPVSGIANTLNDMRASLSTTWSGTAKTTYEIKISSAATPDQMTWRAITRDANGQKSYGAWATAANITGAAQALANNAQVTFGATTGHTANDVWRVQMYEVLPRRIKMALKGLVMHWYSSKGTGLVQTVSGQLISLPMHLRFLIDSLRVETL